ncbi:MAG: metalloregulator ArsR/SmtB family transcription factor [Verrucomicrobiota bacterium]
MASILKSLRGLADPTRLRILLLLRLEKLSVAELQEILSMGQSRISTQLSQLRQAGLVVDHRSGKRVIYEIQPDPESALQLHAVLDSAQEEIEDFSQDEAALQLVLEHRSDRMRAYFDELAGKFGRAYVPGRSWKSLAETLLKLMPPLIVADLGAGEGTLSQLLAQRARKVIAVDNSKKMVEYGAKLARQNGVMNLEYRLGNLETPPIDSESVDLTIFSQALHHASDPKSTLLAASRILNPGGTIVILDLLRHSVEETRELYQDVWLGFSEFELQSYLKNAQFDEIETAVVDRETEHPHFQTLLGIASKPL